MTWRTSDRSGAVHQAPRRIEDRPEPQVVRRHTDQVGERPGGDLAELAVQTDRLGAVRRRHPQGDGGGDRPGVLVAN